MSQTKKEGREAHVEQTFKNSNSIFGGMAVPLDPIGNVVLSLQIVILFLLILGLPFVKRKGEKKNLIRHGYLTTLALVLHTITILIVMVPSFSTNPNSIGNLSILQSITVWMHAATGTAAEILGIAVVASWAFKPLQQMTCARRKWLMMPTFIIWTVSLITGAVIHVVGII
ncbi:MAG: hypothetical protein ABR962_10985 [Candidatus Bathyarchaeia archaeon]